VRIYIAGPYSTDPEFHTKRASIIAAELAQMGHDPLVPHSQGGLMLEHDPTLEYETFMRIDMAWMKMAEAVVRFSGHSPGADREVALANELKIPVYYYPHDMHKLGASNGTAAKNAKVDQLPGVTGRKAVDRIVRATCGS
jgi:hypothetical protein